MGSVFLSDINNQCNMTDKTLPKKTSNQLLTASVTGGLEDFSQNVVLFPAKTKTPLAADEDLTTVYQGSQAADQTLSATQVLPPAQFFNTTTFPFPSSPSPLLDNVTQQFESLQPFKEGANVHFTAPFNPNVNPLPYGTPNLPSVPPPTATAGKPGNLYRRADTKKVAYAQVPGLTSGHTANYPAFTPPVQDTPQSTFLQPSFSEASISPAASVSPAAQNFFTPSPYSVVSSPVMSAISDSEVAQISTQATTELHSQIGLQNPRTSSNMYRIVYYHWFHKKVVEGRTLWLPFSMVDSLALEEAFNSADTSPTTTIATDGGRFDVNILRRERYPVYWTSPATEVRRCSWFYKGTAEGRFVPYEENVAKMLEDEYRTAFETNEWHRKVLLPNGDTVVFHGPDVLVFFPPSQTIADSWGNTPQAQTRPQVVKRGMDEFDIDDGEPAVVDHLLFIVHGIGAVCDLKFRTVEEVVDEFRSISLQLIKSHYKASCENGTVNRVEILPISWHSRLHSEDTGIDKNLKSITLQSIPRLREFTNDTLLDILFYTSPIYCQTIITTVGTELNRIYELFKHRNPSFKGGVSLGGHSLGSLILFDLLSHQHAEPEKESTFEEDPDGDVITELKKPRPKDRRLNRRISYMMSEAGTGQPQLHYPGLNFHPCAFFAIGSPIGMFVTVRGLDNLGVDFALPTCPSFFNIFHPYDPVAYRVESLINSELADVQPVLIPHHKGRKRMHLELKETMARVGADLKQKLIDSMKNTWSTFFQVALFGRQDAGRPSLEAEVDKVLEQQLAEEEAKQEESGSQIENSGYHLNFGMLNQGRRIDYVLQEAPFESFNEYIFALTSHVCYWDSEDTILLILKEIYINMHISADNRVPAPTLTIEKRTPSPVQEQVPGMNSTLPLISNVVVGPPPTSGFVRKS